MACRIDIANAFEDLVAGAWSRVIGTLDVRDVWYLLFGLAFFGLTLAPALSHWRSYNLPAIYVALGMLSSLLELPLISPLGGDIELAIIEHVSELIVIISLAGAGLAINTPASWRNWQPTWHLLIIVMPISVVAVTWLGVWVGGLGLASAMLLGAALAPTDPVLARSVQVGGPGEEEQHAKVALTAEAGLNDGLAFPFVYLALAFAAHGITAIDQDLDRWLFGWASFDVLYRVAAGVIVGWLIGRFLSGLVFSRIGDAAQGAVNPALNFLAWTFVAYGVTEAIDGYGFLAVFVSARAGRHHSPEDDAVPYARQAHRSGDQLEAILLVLLLVWFGSFLAQGFGGEGLWRNWTWSDLAIASLLILVVRPLSGIIALGGVRLCWRDRIRVAVFGVRGMGSIFYIAYGQSHGQFNDIDAVWRIAALTIVLSIIVHGFGARLWMPPDPE